MADSKHTKGKIKQGGTPSKGIRLIENPDSIMEDSPSWAFAACDMDGTWGFCKKRLEQEFWTKIFPKLRELETMTWGDILIKAKKQNHSIELGDLNKTARDRLVELRIEAESLFSLRLSGNIRLYGFMVGAVYNILWYDKDHGDNDSCVCRSKLKHT